MNLSEHISAVRHNIDRKKRLDWNEKQMTIGANSVASSLRDIHDNKLWEGNYATFEDYCNQRWGMTRQRAYQIIRAENARLMLTDAVGDDDDLKRAAKTLNDAQASELERLPKDQAVEVLKDATSKPGKMTARKIKQAKARVVGTQPNPAMSAEVQHADDVERKMLFGATESDEYTEIIDKLVEQEWPISDQKDKTKEAVARIFRAGIAHQREAEAK